MSRGPMPRSRRMLKRAHGSLSALTQSPTAGGLALALAAAAALLVSNSPWGEAYDRFIHLPGEVRIGDWLHLSKPMLLWVNDFWMAVFFFHVGLEIKRELIQGELSQPGQALLPAGAALGGMTLPALIYAALNWNDSVALRGWAIPTATDIAFSLGVLALLGSRVPVSLKVFLTAVAILDDLGAIVVIALFYTENLSAPMLLAAAAGAALLLILNRARVGAIGPYALVGLLVWVCVLKSGVHATLAGVLTALAVPLTDRRGGTPLARAEHALQPWVAFAVLPSFAFVNAGVPLTGIQAGTLLQPVPLGIMAGLVLGKAAGVFAAAWLLVRFAGAARPAQSSWVDFLGVCLLCGIGFTMSLFIGGLAFEGRESAYETQVKLGVLCGSALSGLLGAALLYLRGGRHKLNASALPRAT
jgi:Na+:H+ antiporter, NhaA family